MITLGRNFRSRQEILSAVNFVFAQLMTAEPAEIDYDQRAMLNPGEPYGYEKGPEQGEVFPADKAVELDIIMEQGLEEAQGEQEEAQGDQEEAQEELKSFQLEAQHIASRLLELKNSGYLVFDKSLAQGENNGYRPVRWRDMVILLRAASAKAEILQEAFQLNNIPVFAAVDGRQLRGPHAGVVGWGMCLEDGVHLAIVLHRPADHVRRVHGRLAPCRDVILLGDDGGTVQIRRPPGQVQSVRTAAGTFPGQHSILSCHTRLLPPLYTLRPAAPRRMCPIRTP